MLSGIQYSRVPIASGSVRASPPSCLLTRSAPSPCTNSRLAPEQLVTTVAPRCFASWTAKVPTELLPPFINTRCPATTFAVRDDALVCCKPNDRQASGFGPGHLCRFGNDAVGLGFRCQSGATRQISVSTHWDGNVSRHGVFTRSDLGKRIDEPNHL